MKRLLLVLLVAAAVAASAVAYAGDVDPPSQPQPTSPQPSLREGDKMVHDHEKRDLSDKKKRTKNKGHDTENKVENAGEGVTLEGENMLLVASAADADAQRGKTKKKKRKKKKEHSEPTQITYFTSAASEDEDDLFKFFLEATGEDPIPIPANYTLPAGSYNFTYDNRSGISHNFVVQFLGSGKILAATAVCFECTSSTGIVKLKAHAKVFFHCEPHENEIVPMGFNATIVEST
jgi:hypothetical protein